MSKEGDGKVENLRKSFGEKMLAKKFGMPVWMWILYAVELLCPPLLLLTLFLHLVVVLTCGVVRLMRKGVKAAWKETIDPIQEKSARARGDWNKAKKDFGEAMESLKEGVGESWTECKKGLGEVKESLKEGVGESWSECKKDFGEVKESFAGVETAFQDAKRGLVQERRTKRWTIDNNKIQGFIDRPDLILFKGRALKLADEYGRKRELEEAIATFQQKQREAKAAAQNALIEEVRTGGWTVDRIKKQIDMITKRFRAVWVHIGRGDVYKLMTMTLGSDEQILSLASGKMSITNSPGSANQAALNSIAESANFIAESLLIGAKGAAFLSVLTNSDPVVILLATNKRLLVFTDDSYAEIAHGNLRLRFENGKITMLNTQTSEIFHFKDDSGLAAHFFVAVNDVKEQWGGEGVLPGKRYDVILTINGADTTMLKVALHNDLGMDMQEASRLLQTSPATVARSLAEETAHWLVNDLKVYGGKVELKEVQNEKVKQIVTSKSPSVTQGGDSLAQIEKLAAMKDKGILSEEEFQEQKRKLLARM